MEKQILTPTEISGEFILVEYGESEKYGPYDVKHTVYDSEEQAAIKGNKEAKGNTVFVGITKYVHDGKTYYAPGFNVWD